MAHLGTDLPAERDGRVALSAIHDELASAIGPSVGDWRRLDRSMRNGLANQSIKERALDVLWTNFRNSRLFVFHDSRTCQFIHFWRAMIEEFRVRPVAVILVSRPMESPPSSLLWLRHMLYAEEVTRDLPRAFVIYDSLLQYWPGVVSRLQEGLQLSWPRRSADVELEIERFLSALSRDPNADQPNPPLESMTWLTDTYDALAQLSTKPTHKESLARLDRVRSEFDSAFAAFSPLLSAQEAELAKYRAHLQRLGGENLSLRRCILRLANLHTLRAVGSDSNLARDRIPLSTTQQSADEAGSIDEARNEPGTDEHLKVADEATSQLYCQLKESGLFDQEWYLQRYSDVGDSELDPLLHYVYCGAVEGYDPNPFFDTDWYLERNPDVTAVGLNPLAHYLQHGAAEDRDPSPLFDTGWYKQEYPDVGGVNPLAHYLKHGRPQGRQPRPIK
jgi:hypothetical protein